MKHTYPNGCPILSELDPETRYLYEERAGIIEFCGNTPRDIAEQEAWRQMSSHMLGRLNQATADALRPRQSDL